MKHLLIWILILTMSGVAQASYVAPPYRTTNGGTGTASQTANKAVTTDASGHVVSTSATTDTEVGYLSGVTSAIQTQINGKANTALSNLASTAVNVDLLPGSSNTINIGSSAALFKDAYLNTVKDASAVVSIDPLSRLLKNSSGNTSVDYSGTVLKSSFNLQLQGSSSGSIQVSSGATPTAHTVTLPATVCSSGQYWADNGSGVMSCTSPSSGSLTVRNGGDTAYSILSEVDEVRAGTTLTANRIYTLPVCNASNIGEYHTIKNPPAQTFIITVAANGSDNVDGNANYVLNPGDAVDVICAAFSTNGTWDVK